MWPERPPAGDGEIADKALGDAKIGHLPDALVRCCDDDSVDDPDRTIKGSPGDDRAELPSLQADLHVSPTET